MWVTISHGRDNKPLGSAESEGLMSAGDGAPAGRRLEDTYRVIKIISL